MEISTISSPIDLDTMQAMRGAAGSATGDSFQAMLDAAPKGPGEKRTPAQVRKVAGDLVAQALILPILKQIRRGTFGKGTPFSPGTGEKTFGPEFDTQIADRIAHSPRMAPTDAIAARLMQRTSAGQVKKTPAGSGVDVHG